MEKKLSTDQQLAQTEASEWIKQNGGVLQVTHDGHIMDASWLLI
jgi:hypothetical protein